MFPVRVRQPAFGKCEPASWWSRWLNINLVIICFTLRLRGRRGLLFLEWRFDKFCVIWTTFRVGKPQEGYFPDPEGKSETNCFFKGNLILFVGHLVLGLASGLEAFSREPPCGSIGALVVRRTPETRGMAWEFLSYYPILPSRYLRDPFTISKERLKSSLLLILKILNDTPKDMPLV